MTNLAFVIQRKHRRAIIEIRTTGGLMRALIVRVVTTLSLFPAMARAHDGLGLIAHHHWLSDAGARFADSFLQMIVSGDARAWVAVGFTVALAIALGLREENRAKAASVSL